MKNILDGRFRQFFVALSSLFLFSSCIGQSAELTAMLNSASIFEDLETGQEVKRWYEDNTTALGKPIQAEVILNYEPLVGYSLEDLLYEAIKIVERNNWQMKELNRPRTDLYIASIRQDGFVIEAWLSVDSVQNIVEIRMRTYPR